MNCSSDGKKLLKFKAEWIFLTKGENNLETKYHSKLTYFFSSSTLCFQEYLNDSGYKLQIQHCNCNSQFSIAVVKKSIFEFLIFFFINLFKSCILTRLFERSRVLDIQVIFFLNEVVNWKCELWTIPKST